MTDVYIVRFRRNGENEYINLGAFFNIAMAEQLMYDTRKTYKFDVVYIEHLRVK